MYRQHAAAAFNSGLIAARRNFHVDPIYTQGLGARGIPDAAGSEIKSFLMEESD
jgi:hypothetical protein